MLSPTSSLLISKGLLEHVNGTLKWPHPTGLQLEACSEKQPTKLKWAVPLDHALTYFNLFYYERKSSSPLWSCQCFGKCVLGTYFPKCVGTLLRFPKCSV